MACLQRLRQIFEYIGLCKVYHKSQIIELNIQVKSIADEKRNDNSRETLWTHISMNRQGKDTPKYGDFIVEY